jgi:hypothetical protein
MTNLLVEGARRIRIVTWLEENSPLEKSEEFPLLV